MTTTEVFLAWASIVIILFERQKFLVFYGHARRFGDGVLSRAWQECDLQLDTTYLTQHSAFRDRSLGLHVT